MGLKRVAIETFADGRLKKDFEDALERIVENLLDPDVKQDAVRKIQMNVKIKPKKNSSANDVQIECKTTLAGKEPAATVLYTIYDRETGLPACGEQDLDQKVLRFEDDDEDDESKPNKKSFEVLQ